LHFFYSLVCWTFPFVFVSYLYFFFWEVTFQFICPFINWISCSFALQFFSALHIIWILILYMLINWQRFSLVLWDISWFW
jgi:hypothetical protein